MSVVRYILPCISVKLQELRRFAPTTGRQVRWSAFGAPFTTTTATQRAQPGRLARIVRRWLGYRWDGLRLARYHICAVGSALALPGVTAFVGLPFAGLGAVFLCAAMPMLVWRYQAARLTVKVLQDGVATLGEIASVKQNLHVRINGRFPWTVTYGFRVNSHPYRGQVTTLSQPDLTQRPGSSVYVLYLHDNPSRNTLFPSPYGYFEL